MTTPKIPIPHRCEHPGCGAPNCILSVVAVVVDGTERTEVLRHYCQTHYADAARAARAEVGR